MRLYSNTIVTLSLLIHFSSLFTRLASVTSFDAVDKNILVRYPSEYEYAKLSQHAYTLPPVEEQVPGLEGWKVIHAWNDDKNGKRVPLNQVTNSFSVPDLTVNFAANIQKRVSGFKGYIERQFDFGFAATLYINEDYKQLVLTFRGTSDLMGWATDFLSVVNAFVSPQIPLARAAAELAVKMAGEKGYSLHISGHSLGGMLAELALFFSLIEFETHASAVTFESPGAWELIKNQLLSNLPDIQDQQLEELKGFADLVSLRSYPNLFNTCNTPFGTVKALYPPVLDRSRIPLVYIAEVHSMDRIVEGYERSDAIIPVTMEDWPSWSRLSKYYKVSDFKDQKWIVDEQKYSPFDRYYRAHYKVHSLLNNQNCIHLRHFHRDVRGFLIRLNNEWKLSELNNHQRDQFKSQLISKLHFTEEQAGLLVYYKIDESRILSVLSADEKTNKTAEQFRDEISQLLHHHRPKIEEIILQNPFIQSPSVIPIFAEKQTAKGNSHIDNTVVKNGGEYISGNANFAATVCEVMSKPRLENKPTESTEEVTEQDRPFAGEQSAEDSAIISNTEVKGGRFFQQRELPSTTHIHHHEKNITQEKEESLAKKK